MLQGSVFQVVPVFAHVGNQHVGIFLCEPLVVCHDFRHGLGGSPAAAARFFVQGPHETPHDFTCRFEVCARKVRHPDSQNSHGTFF